MNYEKAFFPYL
jgi:hypothetical protein